ncbi:MAG: sigma-70 family RNA polymerase sigma factor [Bacteroidota bacterium]
MADYRASGDQELLGPLFNSYMHLVYGLCLKYLKSRADSQDAVMSIYEKVSESLKETEVTYFKSWLYMVSKNHCLMQLRKKNPEINTEVFMETPSSSHLNEEDMIESKLNALDECIGELKSNQQRCVRLFFLEKKSYFEIHELTGLTTNKVKSNIQNGKRNLKICLESKRVEE